jgi:DnaJ-class molecular chaperone
VNTGDCLKVSHWGEHTFPNTPAGDLHIHLRVDSSSFFKRKGHDIHSIEYVDIALLMLGGDFKVRTIRGNKNFKLTPGTQADSEFKATEEGIHTSDGKKGTHYITLKPRVPTNLNSEQKEAFEKFAQMLKS